MGSMDIPPVEIHQEIERPHLQLYYFPQCPYCRLVLGTLKQLNIAVELKDIRQDQDALEELIRVGGKRQVPCLFIDGKPLYESREIIAYLQHL